MIDDGLDTAVEVEGPVSPVLVSLDWARAESKELLKTGSACTTVVGPA